jgi:hypothetical protein
VIREELARHWLLLIFAISYPIVVILLALGYPEYFGLVILVFFVGLLPAVFTTFLAVPFAYRYVQFHKWRHRKEAYSEYKYQTVFAHTVPRMRFIARSIIVTVFGIMSIVLSIAGVNPEFQKSQSGVVLIILAMLPAIFLAPSLNFASWLLTKSGTMYENKSDGTRVNLGNELRRDLEFVVGTTALLNFGRAVYTGSYDPGFIVGFVVFLLLLSVPSAVVTVLLLRKRALGKLLIVLNDKLNRLGL